MTAARGPGALLFTLLFLPLSLRALPSEEYGVLKASAPASACSAGNPYPDAGRVPSGWIDWNDSFCTKMDSIWGNMRLEIPINEIRTPYPLQGCHYFTVGSPVPGHRYSSRFDPESPRFEGWLGVYVIRPITILVKGKKIRRAVPVESLFEMGNRDNRGWLHFMGDPSPHSAALVPPRVQCVRHDSGTDLCNKWEIHILQSSHVDVGNTNPSSNLSPIWIVPGSLWNRSVAGFQSAILEFDATAEVGEGDYLILKYASGVRLETAKGSLDTWTPNRRAKLLKVLDRISVDYSAGRPYSCPYKL